MSVPGDYIADVASIPGRAGSYWLASAGLPHYPRLDADIETDVTIVGGGMAGLLTASFLADRGVSVAVLESRRVLGDVTGHTTAKITAQHETIYSRLGEERAAGYAAAQLWGLDEVFRLTEARGIECDLVREDFYLYTRLAERVAELRREAEAAAMAGLDAAFCDEAPLPFDVEAAVKVRDQARFHPLKFLRALLPGLERDGALVFENTRVVFVEDGSPCTVETDSGHKVVASDVVVATNFPVHDSGGYFSRLIPRRTYALALRVDGGEGMAYTDDPGGIALRYQPDEAGTIAIVSGATHPAGMGGDERDSYARLARLATERLGHREFLYHWSTQDNHTADMVPFIGREGKEAHVWLATGFNGWGMTNSFVAARLLSAGIGGEDVEWASVFDPARPDVTPPVGEAAAEAKAPKSAPAVQGECEPAGFAPGDGAVCEIAGEKTAAYKDPAGTVHLMDPHCRHMGCVVTWNEAEKTFDCPCHGSRYDAYGAVIHAPATKDLAAADRG